MAKPDVFFSLLLFTAAAGEGDANSPTVYRNCRIPPPNSTVDVQLLKSWNTKKVYAAKLFMHTTKANGEDKTSSETYYVRGILQPSSSVGSVASVSATFRSDISSPPNTARIQQLNTQLRPLITQYKDIETRGGPLVERCKGQLLNKDCLNSMKTLGMAEVNAANSAVPLLNEKITLLNASPQDAWVRGETEETAQILDQMKDELGAAPAILAELDRRLAGLAEAKHPYQDQPVLKAVSLAPMPASNLSEAVLPIASTTNSGLTLKQVNNKIDETEFPVHGLSDQWEFFQKECPDPTTDELCLDAKRKVILAMQKVYESRVLLFDQKISLLDAGSQDATTQREEDECIKKRDEMKTSLRTFPATLNHLDKSLAEAKRTNEGQ
jgi:hypothetical protein